MEKKEMKELSKYFFWALIVVLIFLAFKIIRPYLLTLISAFILAYLCYPIFKKLEPKIGKSFSAILCIFLILLAIIIPSGILIGGISAQAGEMYQAIDYSSFVAKLNSLKIVQQMNLNIDQILQSLAAFVVSLLTSAITRLPGFIIALVVLFFGIYYFLTDWENLSLKLKQFIPFKDKQKISMEISDLTRKMIYGFLLIAIIQFVVAVVGFYISGVGAYLLLPLFIFFLAFFPGVGPALIWIPLCIYYMYTNNWGAFTGVLITGLVLSLYIDTILRAKIIGKKTNINTLIMFVGILGGISLFGIFGFIIGPLILFYTINFLEELINARS